MLIRITNRCYMNCSHCMIQNSDPNGQHMEMETFRQSLDFSKRIGSMLIVLSGGEPLEHPEIFDLIDTAKNLTHSLVIASNGMFLADKVKCDRIEKTNVHVQITNDKRFYPKRVETKNISSHRWAYIDKIEQVSPCKRTKQANIKTTSIAPKCFNIRSSSRQIGLIDARKMLALKGRFCSPSINIDGSISAGESDTCTIIGHVTDDTKRIERAICSMSCRRCGLIETLSDKYKKAVGESF